MTTTEIAGFAGTGETAGAKAAIVIASREPGVLQILQQELTKRYAADYQIVVCGQPTELASWMKDTLAAGQPVALVIGEVGAQEIGRASCRERVEISVG